MQRFFPSGTGHDSTLWPVLLLLLIVLVPSAGVVWMMRAAMDNERLAVRQRLADAYQAQLEIAKERIGNKWQQSLARLDGIAKQQPPARAFAECVATGDCDSVVIYDGEGHIAYPISTQFAAAKAEMESAAWQSAERLEYIENKPRQAAEAFGAIAATAENSPNAARAQMAQARALAAAGDRAGAIDVLQDVRANDSATDEHGRSLAADSELRLLELLDANSPEHAAVAASLSERLGNYDAPALPPDQRRFLARANPSLAEEFPRLIAAEDLAAAFVSTPTKNGPPQVLQPTTNGNVWQLRSPSDRVTALLTGPTIEQSIAAAIAAQPFPQGVVVEVLEPSKPVVGNDLAAVSLAPTMPGWRLALNLDDSHLFDTAAKERMAFFLWTAVVVVAITTALALLVARSLGKQSRLTRLRNDLVATVSHELKTPLASIRLLVDTLLDTEASPAAPLGDPQRAREYLEMISRENTRLSRLIDNFLTFSRMERGKHRFDMQPIDAAHAVDQAVAAVADRFDVAVNTLKVDIERPLPVVGDDDALVTVVVNLLDNAWKYSDEPKHIAVDARRNGDCIVVSVSDNGIGLSPRAARKVFDRFYQVDQRLSRSHGGCGLGLSIVKYIVKTHGGEVSLVSREGAGTIFTITMPADETVNCQQREQLQSTNPN